MGEELGVLFHRLAGELTWLCWRWNEFEQLFGEKKSRIDILNRSAPFFFYIVQQVLWDEALLGISRLAGPASSMGHANLAVRRVAPLIPEEGLREEVEALIRTMDDACRFASPWRNKRIAHRDLDLALGSNAEPLPAVEKRQVDEAIEAITAVLNHVQAAYQDATTAYRVVGPVDGAEALLLVLRDGLRREELRREKLERGEYDPADWDDELPAV